MLGLERARERVSGNWIDNFIGVAVQTFDILFCVKEISGYMRLSLGLRGGGRGDYIFSSFYLVAFSIMSALIKLFCINAFW